MADKKERKSYMNVELNTHRTTLAKSIDKEYRLKNLRDGLSRYGIINSVSQKKTYEEECSFEEPQGPQWD